MTHGLVDVKLNTVDQLLKAGIPADDIDTVLELRDWLRDEDFDSEKYSQASVHTMIDAWSACEGDMDVLECIVETAVTKMSQVDRRIHVRFLSSGFISKILSDVVRVYQTGGMDAIEDMGDASDETEGDDL